jgi:hypothetical protein
MGTHFRQDSNRRLTDDLTQLLLLWRLLMGQMHGVDAMIETNTSLGSALFIIWTLLATLLLLSVFLAIFV